MYKIQKDYNLTKILNIHSGTVKLYNYLYHCKHYNKNLTV
jgi:hypothetical protein